MNWTTIAESKLIVDIGWTLVHSAWQIALVAFALAMVLRTMVSKSASVKYVVSVSSLLLAVILPVLTFIQISNNGGNGIFSIDRTANINRETEAINTRLGEKTPVSDGAVVHVSESANEIGFAGLWNLGEYLRKQIPVFLPFAVGLWFCGVAIFTLRLIGGFIQLQKFKTNGVQTPDLEWQGRYSALCGKLVIRPAVKLLQSDLITTPIAIGWLKPMIIVPASAFLQINPNELETIIAHELIHIRRYDPLVNILQNVIEVLFFYHPAMWLISAQIRRERELAADASVMEIFSDSHVVYARALANLEEVRHMANRKQPRLAAAANGGNLMLRIERILQKNTEMKRANSAWTAGLALMLISALLTVVFSFSSSSFVNAQRQAGNRKIAIGFVALPPNDRSANPPKDSDSTARLMIAKLTQYKIPAIGFVNGASISDGAKSFPVRANIVRLWRDAGLEIGIGTFKHLSFYNTSYDDYVGAVEKNEAVTRKILAEKNLTLRYFSYPYLNTGKSVEERDRFEKWLVERGLRSVKYTIDNQEWMYSYAYDMARNDNDMGSMNTIRVEFIKYMEKMFDHYEAYSSKMFGHDIAQTMVLTPSRLVVDSADDLFSMIEKRGYSFISMDEALLDEAYKTPENMIGDFGNSWFERWTHSQGKPLLNEPNVDTDVWNIWKSRGTKK